MSLQLDHTKEAQLQLLPQDRVQNVKPCWETIPDEQRVDLLSVDLNELKLRADDLAEKAKKQAGTDNKPCNHRSNSPCLQAGTLLAVLVRGDQ